ncbi:MAG: hypothetical protein Q9219_007587 [cf. Caloplaca sp. 3 TL-2023]
MPRSSGELTSNSFLIALRPLPESRATTLVLSFLARWVNDGGLAQETTRMEALQTWVANTSRQLRAPKERQARGPAAGLRSQTSKIPNKTGARNHTGGAGAVRGLPPRKGTVGRGRRGKEDADDNSNDNDSSDNDDDSENDSENRNDNGVKNHSNNTNHNRGTNSIINGNKEGGGDQELGYDNGYVDRTDSGHMKGADNPSLSPGNVSADGADDSQGSDEVVNEGGNESGHEDGGEPNSSGASNNGDVEELTNGHEGRDEDGSEQGGAERHYNRDKAGDGNNGNSGTASDDGEPSRKDDNHSEGTGDDTPECQPTPSPAPSLGIPSEQHGQPNISKESAQEAIATDTSPTGRGDAVNPPSRPGLRINHHPSTPLRQRAHIQPPMKSLSTPPASHSRRPRSSSEDVGLDEEVNPKVPSQTQLPGPTGLPTPPTSILRKPHGTLHLPTASTPRTHPDRPITTAQDFPTTPQPNTSEDISEQLQKAAFTPAPTVSPAKQQPTKSTKKLGRPSVQSQSIIHGLVNASMSNSTAETPEVVDQTILDDTARYLPYGPLRLGALHIDNVIISATLEQIFGLNDVIALSAEHKQTLTRFVLSFLAPERWWDLRNVICKVVASSGFRNTARLEPQKAAKDPEKERPQCLQNYIDSWHQQRVLCQLTAHRTVTTMLKMKNEMQLYIYWCRLQRIWLKMPKDSDATRVDEGPEINNDCLGGDDAHISAEQEEELVKFFSYELEQREKRLGRKAQRTRTIGVLKSLVAPYLGYSLPLAVEGVGRRGATAKNMFDTLLSKINVRGKECYILQRSLGLGSFAIAKTSHLSTLGSRILCQILPVVRDNFPYLREIMSTVYEVFVHPIAWGFLLLYQDIGSFVHVPSKAALIKVCEDHPNGLKGVFESAGRRLVALIPKVGDPAAAAAAAGPGPTSAELEDSEMPEEPECYDVKALLDQEDLNDFAEEVDARRLGSETTKKKRVAFVEVASGVTRGAKKRRGISPGDREIIME